MPDAPDFSALPVQWQATASDAGSLPTLELAIAAFGCEIEKSGNGPIREFRSAERHLCVFGGRLALECTDDNTVQVRMRPPGASGTRTAKN